MSKRFTETTKWDDPWYIDLSAEAKSFWEYLRDKCDNAGVIDLSERQAKFLINGDKEIDELLQEIGNRVTVLDSGKLWLTGFVNFQFGELSEASNLHKNVILTLKKHNLYDSKIKGIITLKQGLIKGTSKGKGIVKVKVKVKDTIKNAQFEIFWNLYDKKRERETCLDLFLKFNDEDIVKIIAYVPNYVLSTPVIKYRKDPASWLRKKGWLDDIIPFEVMIQGGEKKLIYQGTGFKE